MVGEEADLVIDSSFDVLVDVDQSTDCAPDGGDSIVDVLVPALEAQLGELPPQTVEIGRRQRLGGDRARDEEASR